VSQGVEYFTGHLEMLDFMNIFNIINQYIVGDDLTQNGLFQETLKHTNWIDIVNF
jgi:hypothetical protein